MHDKREREPIRYKIASSRTPLQRCVILEEMPTLTAGPLEKEGFRFGQWLFSEASTPFLRWLITFIDEVELRKETGFGY